MLNGCEVRERESEVSRVGTGGIFTLDLYGWRVVTCFHQAAEENGDICNVAFGEYWIVLCFHQAHVSCVPQSQANCMYRSTWSRS